MKPQKLTMQAFVSYKDRTEIDFTKPNQRLFLITGDTGAGKTTIFDAIVYALYGETSASDGRSAGAGLKSQFAGAGDEPLVELTFSETENGEEKLYTVVRSPQHFRPKKRGTGSSLVAERVTLYLPDGTAFRGNVRETDNRLVEILGLTRDQFMQVSMIAQGEFMNLLRAGSDERKEIFRRLFGTEKYQDIVKELSERRKEKNRELDAVRTVFLTEAGHAEIPADAGGAPSLIALQRKIMKGGEIPVTDMEEFLGGLRGLSAEMDARKAQAGEEVRKAQEERDVRRDQVTGAENLLKFFARREQAERELSAAAVREPAVREHLALGERIRKSYEIREVYRRLNDAEKEAAETREKLAAEKRRLPSLEEAYAAAGEAVKAARKTRKEVSAEAAGTAARADRALALFARIAGARKAVGESGRKKGQAAGALDRAKKAEAAFEVQAESWKMQSEELAEAERRLDAWTAEKDIRDSLDRDAEAAKSLANQAFRRKKAAERAEEAFERAKQSYQAAEQTWQDGQDGFLRAQAGFLAGTLREGEPCPVCGSLSHPRPCALAPEDRKLTREAVEEWKMAADRAAGQYRNAAAASGKAAEGYRGLVERLAESTSRLAGRLNALVGAELPEAVQAGEGHSFPGSERANLPAEDAAEETAALLDREIGELQGLAARLSRERADFDGREEKLRKDAACLAGLRKQLAGADEQRDKLRKMTEKAEAADRAAEADLAAARAALDSLSDSRDFAEESAAIAAKREARERAEAADRAERAAEERLRDAGTARDSSAALIVRYAGELPGRDAAAAERKAEYEQILRDRNLAEEDWQKTVAEHGKEEDEEFRREAEALQRKKAEAEGMKMSADEAIGGREKPELEKLRGGLSQAEETLASAKEKLEKISSAARTNERALRALEPNLRERNQLFREFTRIDSLLTRLGGKRSGFRMDIETFVQRWYLERILAAANIRFRRMSGGQFELRMYSLDEAGEGKNHGLDLKVYSAVTGKERDVNTLSGGESFMAALSLALGMADQIQESSAVIHPDIMFIDEGFGSLDDHAREQAVRVLEGMAGKSRLIGIISHVSELKMEIEDQLIVTRDREGSHVRWQIS
jgi:exonuclease SbcC